MTLIDRMSFDLNDNNLYVKRDDLLPFSFGGNKARKAVKFFDEIENNGNDVVVTYGSACSNHCRIIANIAASKGIKCVIVSPEENYEESVNSKMVKFFGAQIVKTPLTKVSETIENIMQDLKKTSNPYFIQGGGHGNKGTEAYVDAYNEILEYEQNNNVKFDYIFHASGTGTTQAGLVVGRLLNNRTEQKIVGISIARNLTRGKKVILDSINNYFGDTRNYDSEVDFVDDYICGGYGKYNQEIVSIIKDVFKNDGMALNTTYTGKAFYGMKEYILKNEISKKNILFINTGGLPLFFDVVGRIVE